MPTFETSLWSGVLTNLSTLTAPGVLLAADYTEPHLHEDETQDPRWSALEALRDRL